MEYAIIVSLVVAVVCINVHDWHWRKTDPAGWQRANDNMDQYP